MQADLPPKLSSILPPLVNQKPSQKTGAIREFKQLRTGYKVLTVIVSGLAGLFLIFPGILAFRTLAHKLPKVKKIDISSDESLNKEEVKVAKKVDTCSQSIKPPKEESSTRFTGRENAISKTFSQPTIIQGIDPFGANHPDSSQLNDIPSSFSRNSSHANLNSSKR